MRVSMCITLTQSQFYTTSWVVINYEKTPQNETSHFWKRCTETQRILFQCSPFCWKDTTSKTIVQAVAIYSPFSHVQFQGVPMPESWNPLWFTPPPPWKIYAPNTTRKRHFYLGLYKRNSYESRETKNVLSRVRFQTLKNVPPLFQRVCWQGIVTQDQILHNGRVTVVPPPPYPKNRGTFPGPKTRGFLPRTKLDPRQGRCTPSPQSQPPL